MGVLAVGMGSLSDQQVDHGCVAGLSGQMQRRLAFIIFGIHTCPSVNEGLSDFRISTLRGVVQVGLTVAIFLVGVCAFIQMALYFLDAFVLDGRFQRRCFD